MMIHQPLRSSLFPYTTLFRSAGVVAVPINAVEDFKELVFILETTESKLALTTEHNHKVFTRDLLAQKKELPADRKSTRLNSSHSQISYAVFCLKKKNRMKRRG